MTLHEDPDRLLREGRVRHGNGSDKDGRKQRFNLVHFDDLKPSPGRRYLIKGMIPRFGLTLVWGPPKCGKSFWLFDAMMHLALGWEYRGRRVQPGPVVYVALEGQEGMNDRAEAFRRHHGLPPRSAAKFHLIADAMELVADHTALVADIRAKLGDNHQPAAVVIDTVNRSFRGSESSDEDMTAYVQAADAVWKTFKCAVPLVHHCGHEGSRYRGHSSLGGALHAQIAVKRDADDKIIVTVEHMKDGPDGATVASRLEVVDVGTDEDGDPITSCVIVETDAASSGKRRRPVQGQAGIALNLLNQAVIDAGETPPPNNHIPGDIRAVPMSLWRSYCYQGGICKGDTTHDARKKAFNRAADKLQAYGSIGIWDEWVWPG